MTLKYQSGDEIKPADRVLFHGEPGAIEFVVHSAAPDRAYQWYIETFGRGVMIAEPKVVGHAFIQETEEAEDLVLVSRAEG